MGWDSADRLDEVARAHLPGRGRGEEGQDAQPGGIGERGEAASQHGGVGFAQGCVTDRRAALVGLEHGDHLLSGHDHTIH